MEKVNIKIGQTTYSDVSVLNVDKANGGSANFIYNGVVAPAKISTYMDSIGVTSRLRTHTPIINTKIELR